MKYRTATSGHVVTFTFPDIPDLAVVLNARDFQSGKQMVAEAIRQAEDANNGG